MASGIREPWYKTWFGSVYYDMLYHNRDNEEAADFAVRLMTHLALPAGARILDAGCGKGRYAGILSAMQFQVTGIDLCPSNIRIAQSNIPEATFYTQDMRRKFRVHYFDLIVNFHTSFGYFDNPSEDIACLHAFHSALRSEGLLVIDFLHTAQAIRTIGDTEILEKDNIRFRFRRHFENGYFTKQITIEDGNEVHHACEKVRAITPEEFYDLCSTTGFEIVDTFGDYRLTPFDSRNSERFIFIAKRKDVS